jgi:DNA processing protein
METREDAEFSILTPEDLLGPLNDVEQKYAPEKLYLKGPMKIPLPGPRASIVGSRKASSAGLDAAAAITKTLVRSQVIIVSGLAQGIDTAAHTTCIRGEGRTIAVLGTPLDQSYPKQNAQLQQTIMREHLVISQFALGHPVLRKNFVIRNLTMALISNATIIMEAKDDSGSLHQGWEALRLGRPLFIWKTVLNDSSLRIPRKMLDYGAIELGNPEEILQFLPSSEPVLEIAQ